MSNFSANKHSAIPQTQAGAVKAASETMRQRSEERLVEVRRGNPAPNALDEIMGNDEYVLENPKSETQGEGFEPVRELERGRSPFGDDETEHDPINDVPTQREANNNDRNKPVEFTLAEIRQQRINSHLYQGVMNKLPETVYMSKLDGTKLDTLKEEAHQLRTQYVGLKNAIAIRKDALPKKLAEAFTKIYHAMDSLDSMNADGTAASRNTIGTFANMARKAQKSCVYGWRAASPDRIQQKKRWIAGIKDPALQEDQYETVVEKVARGTGNLRWGLIMTAVLESMWAEISKDNPGGDPIVEDWYVFLIKMELDGDNYSIQKDTKGEAFAAALDFAGDLDIKF